MDSFSQWVAVDKDTGRIFADGQALPVENVRRWSLEDDEQYPIAKSNIPSEDVLVAPTDLTATYCYGVSYKEAKRAGLLPEERGRRGGGGTR